MPQYIKKINKPNLKYFPAGTGQLLVIHLSSAAWESRKVQVSALAATIIQLLVLPSLLLGPDRAYFLEKVKWVSWGAGGMPLMDWFDLQFLPLT